MCRTKERVKFSGKMFQTMVDLARDQIFSEGRHVGQGGMGCERGTNGNGASAGNRCHKLRVLVECGFLKLPRALALLEWNGSAGI